MFAAQDLGPVVKVHFVADVHLVDGQPATWVDFFEYLAGPARECDHVYLLGDVFHAWIGDDDDRQLACEAKAKLRQLTDSGVRASFIFGNHDFMVGKRFARETGVSLLGEMATIEVAGHRLVLLHGDTLLTSDQRYQSARRKFLRPHFLFYARLLPRWLRRRRGERMLSDQRMFGEQVKAEPVDEDLVNLLLKRHDAQALIHGHTHHCGNFPAAADKVRWSLPAWTGGESGGWLQADSDGLRPLGNWGKGV